jgi:hypothetical protein
VRGLLYEAGGEAVPPEVLATGVRIVLETAERNSIPAAVLQADPTRLEDWLAEARAAIERLLEGPRVGAQARYAGHHIPKSRSAFSGEASTEEDS